MNKRLIAAALTTAAAFGTADAASAETRLKQANAHQAVVNAAEVYDALSGRTQDTYVARERAGRRLSPTAFRYTATILSAAGAKNVRFVARLVKGQGIVVTTAAA